MTFEEHKQRKLDRMLGLRIMNYLGMVAWHETENGDAQQKLRRVHPFTWIWFVVVVIISTFMYGFIEVRDEVRNLIIDETVWW